MNAGMQVHPSLLHSTMQGAAVPVTLPQFSALPAAVRQSPADFGIPRLPPYPAPAASVMPAMNGCSNQAANGRQSLFMQSPPRVVGHPRQQLLPDEPSPTRRRQVGGDADTTSAPGSSADDTGGDSGDEDDEESSNEEASAAFG